MSVGPFDGTFTMRFAEVGAIQSGHLQLHKGGGRLRFEASLTSSIFQVPSIFALLPSGIICIWEVRYIFDVSSIFGCVEHVKAEPLS